jgi:ATP-dependent RNA helicase DHX57
MIERVLARTIEPPPSTAVRVAVEVLTDIGALDADEALTPLGAHLARMPVDCRIGKMLIFGAMFRCVTPVVAIAALMSNKSPFVAPLEKREAADAARAKFACFQSDHITLLRAFEGWRAARLEGRSAENEYVSTNFLSRAVLETAEDACGEYMNALVENGFVAGAAVGRRVRGKASWTVPAVLDENAANIRVLKGVLCAGLYPNIIRAVHPDKRYTQVAEGAIARVPNARDIKYFTEDDGRVFMHPTSVNFHTQTFASPWLAFLTKVQTAKVYVRDATVISSYALLLFGGEIRVDRTNGFIVVGDWIRFHADLKIAILIKELRRELDKLMWAKIADPDVDIGSSPICAALLRLVTSDGSDFAERTVGGASSADVGS